MIPICTLLTSLTLLFFFRRISPTNLLFEQINLASIISALILTNLKQMRKRKIDFKQLEYGFILGLAISFTLNSALLNIDRSRSFYVLSWVANDQVIRTENALEVLSTSNESKPIQAIEQRVEENKSRGLITEDAAGLELTKLGRVIFSLSNILSDIFQLNNWKMNQK